MLRLLLAALALATPARASFGTFSLEPPPTFRADAALAARTLALAPAFGEGEPDRRLVGFYSDGAGPEAASLALSSVDEPLPLDPGLRQLYASSVAGHFKHQLELPYTLDHVRFSGSGPSRRVEVWGAVKLDGQERAVVTAFYPGQRTHAVLLASLPASRQEELGPSLQAALDSFVPSEPPAPWARSRMAINLLVWGLAGIALVAFRLYRRRRAQDEDEA